MTHIALTTANEVRDEILSIRRQYREEAVGRRGRLYEVLARAAAVTIEITKNPTISISLKPVHFSAGRGEFAATMAAILFDGGGYEFPRRILRHAAVVSYLVNVMGKTPSELPTELRNGIENLARHAAAAKRKARERRLTRQAIRDFQLGISESDVRRMAAQPSCSLVMLVLKRQDDAASPFRAERVRYLAAATRPKAH